MSRGLRWQQFPAWPELAHCLDHVWLLEGVGTGEAQPIWPDGCTEWVFQLGDPFEQQSEEGRWQRQGRRLCVGQQLRHVRVRPGPQVHSLGLHFHPAGMASLIEGDQRRFTGQILALDQVLGEDLAPMARRLGSLSGETAAEAVQRWLLSRRPTPGEPRLLRAVQALQDGIELAPLAQALGWSERQLRRRFETAVGLAPKRYARLARFQRVAQLGKLEDAKAWAEAALDAGYCDQAHFSRDFRAFTGASPRELLRDLAPLTACFVAMSESSKTRR